MTASPDVIDEGNLLCMVAQLIGKEGVLQYQPGVGLVIGKAGEQGTLWNPFMYEDQSFRLMIRLHIRVEAHDERVTASWKYRGREFEIWEDYKLNDSMSFKYAQARLVIMRAAYDIAMFRVRVPE